MWHVTLFSGKLRFAGLLQRAKFALACEHARSLAGELITPTEREKKLSKRLDSSLGPFLFAIDEFVMPIEHFSWSKCLIIRRELLLVILSSMRKTGQGVVSRKFQIQSEKCGETQLLPGMTLDPMDRLWFETPGVFSI